MGSAAFFAPLDRRLTPERPRAPDLKIFHALPSTTRMVSPSYAEVPGRVSVSGEFERGLIDALRRVDDGQIGRAPTRMARQPFAVGEQLLLRPRRGCRRRSRFPE